MMNPLQAARTMRPVALARLPAAQLDRERRACSALIERDGLKGVTSNPSIFEKAIGESDEYDDAIKAVLRPRATTTSSEIYEHLAIADIRAAADVLRPSTTRRRAATAMSAWKSRPISPTTPRRRSPRRGGCGGRSDRPNLMVKVPATPAGMPAIRQLIGERDQHQHHAAVLGGRLRAGGRGLSRRPGGPQARGRRRLEHRQCRQLLRQPHRHGSRQADRRASATRQRGGWPARQGRRSPTPSSPTSAIKAMFSGPRWEALAAAGAAAAAALGLHQHQEPGLQRRALCRGPDRPDTVNTMPPATMDAFRDHGRCAPSHRAGRRGRARERWPHWSGTASRSNEVTDQLVEDGVRQFADAFDKLLGAVAQAAPHAVRRGERTSLEIRPGLAELDDRVRRGAGALAQGGPHPAALGGRHIAVDRPTRTIGSAGWTSSSRNCAISRR